MLIYGRTCTLTCSWLSLHTASPPAAQLIYITYVLGSNVEIFSSLQTISIYWLQMTLVSEWSFRATLALLHPLLNELIPNHNVPHCVTVMEDISLRSTLWPVLSSLPHSLSNHTSTAHSPSIILCAAGVLKKCTMCHLDRLSIMGEMQIYYRFFIYI